MPVTLLLNQDASRTIQSQLKNGVIPRNAQVSPTRDDIIITPTSLDPAVLSHTLVATRARLRTIADTSAGFPTGGSVGRALTEQHAQVLPDATASTDHHRGNSKQRPTSTASDGEGGPPRPPLDFLRLNWSWFAELLSTRQCLSSIPTTDFRARNPPRAFDKVMLLSRFLGINDQSGHLRTL